MPKSRALKEETMPMMKQDTPEDMMKDGQDMMTSAKNSMMRGKVMMLGAKAMQAMMSKKKRHINQEDMDDMMQYSDLGGLNFDPKKFKMKGLKKRK